MLTVGWRFSTARDRGLTPWRASCPWGPPWPWWSASMTSSVSIPQSVRSITTHSNHVMRQSGSSDMRQLSFSPDHSHGTLGPVWCGPVQVCNGDELSLTRRVEYFSLQMNNHLLLKNPKKFNRLKANFLYRADMRPQLLTHGCLQTLFKTIGSEFSPDAHNSSCNECLPPPHLWAAKWLSFVQVLLIHFHCAPSVAELILFWWIEF